MKQILVLLLGILAATGLPVPARANGGDLHFGELHTGIPPVVMWVGLGVVVLVFVFLVIGWAVSRRSLKQRSSQEANISEREKEEQYDHE